MKSVGGKLPRLYGLAKVHKKNIPVRPVLSMPGSPYYKLAEKIIEWLSVIPEAKINCLSKQTLDNLRNIFLDHDKVVISLYTNVPVKEAIFEAQRNCILENLPCHRWIKELLLFLLG